MSSADQKRKQCRKWMKQTGKKLDFTDAELVKMRLYFNQLDDRKEGYIGANQLFEPLVSLGIVSNRAQLNHIIFSVDDDGMIHFQEFLNILKIKARDYNANALVSFFKNLIKGRVGARKVQPGLPFKMLIDQIRRQQLKRSIYEEDPRKRLKGLIVTRNFMYKLQDDGVYCPSELQKSVL